MRPPKLASFALCCVLAACISLQVDSLLDTAKGDPDFAQAQAELEAGFPELGYDLESIQRQTDRVTYAFVTPEGQRVQLILERVDAQHTRMSVETPIIDGPGAERAGGDALLRAMLLVLAEG